MNKDTNTPKGELSGAARTEARFAAMTLVILTPAQMQTEIKVPDYQREINEGTVKDIMKSIAQGKTLSAGMLSRNTFDKSKKKNKALYTITDANHRRIACIRANIPMAFNLLAYDTATEERESFVTQQLGRKMDASHLVKIHPEMPNNAVIINLAQDPKHNMFNRIWFGSGAFEKDQLRAAKLVSATKYGLMTDDIAEFADFLGTSTEDFDKEAIKAGSLRALVQFYNQQLKGLIKPSDNTWAFFWARINWASLASRDETASNCATAGREICTSLTEAWGKHLERFNRQAAQREEAI